MTDAGARTSTITIRLLETADLDAIVRIDEKLTAQAPPRAHDPHGTGGVTLIPVIPAARRRVRDWGQSTPRRSVMTHERDDRECEPALGDGWTP